MENSKFFEDIKSLIETIDGEDFSEIGMLVNSLQNLNAVANEGSVRGLSDTIYSIKTALSSLHSISKNDTTKKSVEGIQKNIDQVFNTIQNATQEQLNGYSNYANEIVKSYQNKAMGTISNFTPATVDMHNSKFLGKMKKSNQQAYESLTNGILLMQESAWEQSMKALESVHSQPFTSESIKNSVNERTKTIASRRRAYEKMINDYTASNAFGLNSKDIGSQLLEKLNKIPGGSSRTLHVNDPFGGLADELFNSLSQNFKDNVGSKSVSGQSTVYTNTSDVSAAISNMVNAVGKDLKSFMGYDYFASRTKLSQGQGKALDTFDTMQGELTKAMNVALQNGIGSFLQTTNGGKAFKLGFFNQGDAHKIFKTTQSGARTADWSQMASVDIGIPDKLGNMLLNGMSVADYMVGDMDKNGTISYKTLSQTVMENISTMMNSRAVTDSLHSGDVRKAQYLITKQLEDILPQAPHTGSYKDPASAAFDEILSDSKAGSTTEQSAMRASQMVNSRIYRAAYDKYFRQHGEYNDRKALQMHDYTYAKYLDRLQGSNINSAVFDNNKDYSWLTSGSKIIDNIAEQMATISSNIGIGGLKEPTYNAGRFLGLDANVFAPFHAMNVGSNRALSQSMNYVHRSDLAKRRQKDLGLQRTLFDSAIGKKIGVDYGDAEHLQYTLGRTDDYAVNDAIKEYYDQLLSNNNIEQISRLSKRYLSEFAVKGKSASEVVDMLKKVPMASVAEGGAIVSDLVMSSLQSKRISESHKITADDLRAMGIDAPVQGQTLKNISPTNIGIDGLDLPSGLHIGKLDKIKGITDMGDGLYQIDMDKHLPLNAVQKILTSNGDRLMARAVDNDMFKYIAQKIGMSGAHLLTERKDYSDTRKTAGAIEGRYEFLAQEYLRQGGTIESLQKAISQTPILKDFLSYDGEGFHTDYSNPSAFKSFLTERIDGNQFKSTEAVANYLSDFEDPNGAFYGLANKLFAKGGIPKSIIDPNMESAALRGANEYSYFDPVGSISKSVAQYDSRYKITSQQRDAMLRTQGLYSFMSSNSVGTLGRVLNQYMSHDPETYNALELEKQALVAAQKNSEIGNIGVSRQGQQIRIVNKPVDSLADNEIALSSLNTDLIYRPDGTVASADWKASVLGAVAEKARALGGNVTGAYIDIENSGGSVSFDGKGYKSLGVPILPTADGDYITPKPFEGLLNSVVRHMQDRVDISADQPSEYNMQRFDYESEAIGRYSRNAFNEMYNATENKGGYIRSQLENVRATNAMAAKAQANNIAQFEQYQDILQDSLVLNPEDIAGMLRTGKGGDRLGNVEKLSWMYEDLLQSGGADSKRFTTAMTKLQNIKSGRITDDNGSKLKGIETSLINGILDAISLESGGGQLAGLLHRYPLINGQDIKHLGIRASKGVERGRMVTGKGVERAINLDYDGDTGYASLALFGAKTKEEFMQANKEFKEIQSMQSEVNSLIGNMAIRKYQKDNGISKDGKRVQGETPSISKAMEKLYSDEGQQNTLLADLKAKGNFSKVGLLSNYSRDMRTTLFNNALDETGSNPLNAAQSMIARAFFESFEQNAISSKKIDSKIREATKGQNPEQQRAYLENSLSQILDYVNNIGKVDSNGIKRDWAGLIKLGQSSGIFGDSEEGLISDRVSHQAVGNIQVMAKRRFGEDTKAYTDFMNSLGFGENLFGSGGNFEGALSVKQVLGALSSLEKISMDKTGKSLSDNRWASRQSYYGYTKLDNAAIDAVERSKFSRIQSALNAQEKLDQGVSLEEAQKTGATITGAGDQVVTLLANIAQTLGTLAGTAQSADAATKSYAQSLIDNVNAINAGTSAAKGYAAVFNGQVAYMVGARQNANYENNHKYDVTSLNDGEYSFGGQTAQYSTTQIAKMLTGGSGYKDAETMKVLGDAIDSVRGTGEALTAKDFGLSGESGAKRWDSLRQNYMKTSLGTYQHANTQYVNEVNEALDAFTKIGSYSGNSGLYDTILGDIESARAMGLTNATEIANNPAFAQLFNTLSSADLSGLDSNNPFSTLLNQLASTSDVFSAAKNKFTTTAQALGLGDYVQGDQDYVDTATKNMFKTIQQLAGSNGFVASEMAAALRLGDTTIGGAMDNVIYNPDTKTMTALDNKNTSFTSNENVLQQMMYSAMLKMTQSKVQSVAKDFISANGANTDLVENGHITEKGYMEMANAAHAGKTDLMLGKNANQTANLLKGFNEAEAIYTKLGTIAENGSTEVKSIIEAGVSKVISLIQTALTGQQLSSEELKSLQGYVSKIADVGSHIEGKDGVKRNDYGLIVTPEVSAEEKQREKQAKAAMKSGLASQKAYDNAELNMLRAQRALEKARASGNAEAIYGAEQQLEGARSQAAIASQYRSQFGAVDANGNVIKTTDANGRPLSLQQLQQAGVDINNMHGMTRVWDADLGDWKNVELSAAQTKQHITDMSMQWAKQQQAIGKVGTQVKTVGSLVGEVLGGMKQTIQYLMRTSIVYAAIGKVKQAFATLIQTTQALNKSYVDLRIASGQTDSQMKDSLKVYNQMAKEMGKTTQEVANAANDWLRAGYNAEESAKLIKNSMQLSTVGMIDSAKATEYLISTMKGWKLGVDDMEGVIDKMAELDRNEINNMAYHENGKSYPLNCWEILKLDKLQRNDEIYVSVICDESRKNYQDDTRLKPKCYCNRCSAAKLRIEESSTINRLVSGVGMKANVIPKRWASVRAMI